MPLSDHEQRLLDEIEQALYAEDPKFVSSVRSARARTGRRRALIIAVLGVVLGLGLVLVGLMASIIPLSVFGFVLVVAASGYGVQGFRGRSQSGPTGVVGGTSNPRRRGTARSNGLRARMEERLHKRFDQT